MHSCRFKRTVRLLLPKVIRRKLFLLAGLCKLMKLYFQEFVYFVEYSSAFSGFEKDKSKIEARIIANYHIFEKGLSLKEIKFNFGRDMLKSLIELLTIYKERFPVENSYVFLSAISVMRSYIRFHEENGIDMKELDEVVDRLCSDKVRGGVLKVAKQNIIKGSKADFYEFVKSRHSIRNFTEQNVEIKLILKAIEIAQTAPSVCNRQSVKIHIITDHDEIAEVLELQRGSRGFGHLSDKVLVVTSDMNSFFDFYEPNQCYVDAGMFGMNLLYGLHYCGLGACSLCWYNSKKTTSILKEKIGIPENEKVVMLIAVGHMPEEFKVAESKRFPFETVYSIR